MNFTREELEAAMHLLFHYGLDNGRPPGSFHATLIVALERADDVNQMKLLSVFPEYQMPVSVLKTTGSSALEEMVSAELEKYRAERAEQ